MKVSLRLCEKIPTLCIAKGEIWCDAQRAGILLGLHDLSPLTPKQSSIEKWTENLMVVEGLWEYLLSVDSALSKISIIPEELHINNDAEYLPPLTCPPLIFGLAGNCPMTWRKNSIPIPNYPVGYVRPWSSLSAHNQRVVLESSVTSFRCAVELGVVIGRRARNVTRKQAMDFVFAYTIVNDMISNHWKDFAKQSNPVNNPTFHELLVTSYYGRGSNGFCPMGPALVSKDEIANPYDLLMWTRVNGALVDRAHTNAMVVGIENAIEYLSSIFPLEPGSVIHMGTMGIDGVTLPADSKLCSENYVELEIEGIGALRTYFDDRRNA